MSDLILEVLSVDGHHTELYIAYSESRQLLVPAPQLRLELELARRGQLHSELQPAHGGQRSTRVRRAREVASDVVSPIT